MWMLVSDRDLLNARDEYHDWVLANENMAKVLAAKDTGISLYLRVMLA